MSLENLQKFGELCEQDAEVGSRVKEIGMDPDAVIKYAAEEHQLEFTQDDLLELAQKAGNSTDELDEDDLDKIAGGVLSATMLAVFCGVVMCVGFVTAKVPEYVDGRKK